jgi:hypothetical protein
MHDHLTVECGDWRYGFFSYHLDSPSPPDAWGLAGYHPSVYFKPSEVWEIRGAE